jgi:PAS domain S-box-containing protein
MKELSSADIDPADALASVRSVADLEQLMPCSHDLGRVAKPSTPISDRVRDAPVLSSMVSTAELDRRPSRPADLTAENQALIALAQALATAPETILQKLADTALVLCRAHSAGLSLLEESDQKRRFHWRAIAGQWASHRGGGTPREFGPCGTVLDRNTALLCSHPERDFPYFGEVTPLLEEALLIPFYVKGEALGTIWVVSHDQNRRFDKEDLRLMTNLGTFAAAAYQTTLSLNATQQIASIVESSDDAIVSKSLDGIIRTWNQGAEQLFGYAAEEIVGKPVTILIPPERHDEEPKILARVGRGERIDHYETVRRRKDGSLVEISLSVSPVRASDGKIIGASKIARDITERKRADEKISLLAREAEHRARNVLATVQAAVHLSQADTPDDLKTAIGGRIQALANVHTLFVQSQWKGAELHTLITQELSPYSHDGQTHLHIDGPDLLLDPDTAQTIAVSLHELATNAAKYGSLSVPDGKVHIEAARAADGTLSLQWTETGGPIVKQPERRGFGSRVMDAMIRNQSGEIRFNWHAEGLVCEMTIPTRS